MHAGILNKPLNYLTKIERTKFSNSNLIQLKKEYMKKYGLNFNNPKEYAAFNFKLITLDNPF